MVDDTLLKAVDEKLKLILRQFYEIHERVQELEKERNSIDKIIIRYGMIILILMALGVVLWAIM